MKDLKIIFMGTPNFSVAILKVLIGNCNVIGVVTQPDRRTGRDEEVKFSPIKELAIQNNIPVFQPEKIKTEFQSIIDLKPDMIVTCAYGQIIPKEVLECPKYKCINVHPSLLPKLRGGAPLHRAIMEGYSKTGVTIMYMSERMDAGDIIRQVEVEILPADNVGILHDKLSLLGAQLLIDTIPDIISGNITRTKQNEDEVTFASNLTRADEKIDFSKSKREIFNKIRGLNPWPGAYMVFEGKVVKVWNSRIGDNYYSGRLDGEVVKLYEDGIGIKVDGGEIILTELQFEGKKRLKAREYLNGIQNKNNLIGRMFE
ncbi:MAG: methionyl-tRNA formyltransferase [Bacilli bacterium]|nr:methionyl-tRNA formyltransferase [Bacilli bacterium]